MADEENDNLPWVYKGPKLTLIYLNLFFCTLTKKIWVHTPNYRRLIFQQFNSSKVRDWWVSENKGSTLDEIKVQHHSGGSVYVLLPSYSIRTLFLSVFFVHRSVPHQLLGVFRGEWISSRGVNFIGMSIFSRCDAIVFGSF